VVSVETAKKIIDSLTVRMLPAKKSLKKAAGMILAKDVLATTDIPGFDQSSVDGYAIHVNEILIPLKIAGEMAAGASRETTLHPGQAMRIFTGAPLPAGADTVVMQEHVQVKDDVIMIENKSLVKGNNVRTKGAEIIAGNLALEAGSLLSPAAIGFLAGIGAAEVTVYPLPSVCIIITGDELKQPGTPLQFGQVYDANSYQLTAALQQAGITDITLREANDDPVQLQQILQDALDSNDMVLLTGGVSVGDYDFVIQAADACEVDNHFHKVKQRPGKPLYFGTKGRKPVFGLPGNPSSVLVCFYQYVLPCLAALSGKDHSIEVINAPLGADHKKIKGLTFFLKGNYQDGIAMPLAAQESFRLSSFARANCLIELEEQREEYSKGETVTVHLLFI
jgi:molybdopterin molybdotransferase